MTFARAYAMHLAWEQIANWQGMMSAADAAEGCGWPGITRWETLAHRLADWWLDYVAEETRRFAMGEAA